MWTAIIYLTIGYAIGAYRVKIWNWLKSLKNKFAG